MSEQFKEQGGVATMDPSRLTRWLTSRVMTRLSRPAAVAARHRKAEQARVKARAAQRVEYFHQVDEGYSFLAADEMLISSYEALFEVESRAGTLSERVARAIELYGNAFEKLRPIILCTQAQLWRSPKLRENYAWHQKRLRKELELWLPEVAELPKDRREAVHAVASFSMWNRLREFQGLSIKTSADIVTSLVTDLIAAS